MEDILDEHLRGKKGKPQVYKKWPLVVSGLFTLLGIALAVLHLPGGGFFTVTAPAAMAAWAFSGMISPQWRDPLFLVTGIAGMVWTLYLLSDVLLIESGSYNMNALAAYAIVFFFVLFLAELHKGSINRNNRRFGY